MNILFITLSNIGDVILSLPVLDKLIYSYPEAEITVLCGQRAEELFKNTPGIKNCIIYHKRKGILNVLKLIGQLNKDRFDLIVDLKNSALPLFLYGGNKTYPWVNAPANIRHMRDRHLYKIKDFISDDAKARTQIILGNSLISDNQMQPLAQLCPIITQDKFVVISPGARSHIKCWKADKFAALADKLINELALKVILAGDESDAEVCQAVDREITKNLSLRAPSGSEGRSNPFKIASVASLPRNDSINLCGATTLKSLAGIIKHASLIVTNDSAVMHLASYLNRPVVAIFGPTDEIKYGPWSSKSRTIRKKIECAPCELSQCPYGTLECIKDIKVEEVFQACERLLI